MLSNIILVFIIKIDNGYLFIINTVIINIIISMIALISYNKEYSLVVKKPDVYVLYKYMRMGILLTIGNMSYILFASIDKWFIKGFFDIKYFAYYSFAVQLLSALNMFVTPISLTLYSYISRNKDGDFEYELKLIILTLLFSMLSGVFIIKIIICRFITKYSPALSIIIILFLSQVFMLLNTSIYVNMYKAYKLQKKYFENLIIAIIISLISNGVAIFIFGKRMEFIAIATLFSMIIWALLNLHNFRHLKLKFFNLLYVIIMSLSFLLCNLLKNYYLSLIIYIMVLFLFTYIFMPVVFKKAITDGKNIISKMIGKVNKYD